MNAACLAPRAHSGFGPRRRCGSNRKRSSTTHFVRNLSTTIEALTRTLGGETHWLSEAQGVCSWVTGPEAPGPAQPEWTMCYLWNTELIVEFSYDISPTCFRIHKFRTTYVEYRTIMSSPPPRLPDLSHPQRSRSDSYAFVAFRIIPQGLYTICPCYRWGWDKSGRRGGG